MPTFPHGRPPTYPPPATKVARMSGSSSSMFWLLALPLKHREVVTHNNSLVDEDRNILYSFLKDKLSVSSDVAEVHQFAFPEFKVGTLDSLVAAGEDLSKMDPVLETTVNRLVSNFRGLLNGDSEQLRSSLVVNEVATPEAYVKSFQWNVMKYRTDKTVTEIADTIVQETQQIESLLKARLNAYSQAKSSVAAAERKNTGTFLTKDLGSLVTAKDFIEPSEFMQTLLVVVTAPEKKRWEAIYEHLSEMVVPRSSRLLAEEDGYALYNVTVFNKVKDEFIKAASAERFTVREYDYDENRQQEIQEADQAMQSDMKAQWASLVRLLKTNFGELFSAWMHLKVLRLFVESVLQYGLPPYFLSLTLKPGAGKDSTKGEKKLRLALLQNLEQLHLPGISPIDIAAALQSAASSTMESAEEAELWTALNMANGDQDPFVKVSLQWSIQ
ncbi:ATPase, V1 complex, subunit C domain-containing protein [Paramicrosporidium saccamoebae]|uniref:V-type proton ATPase subunit C n=1 Tax=Paramicrosporidium saccamoebae TaxID=1246581 RepID=A0A2H9TIX5_9FUNG|nr:ATPase, V1 complex, subunit C domain-containing protein [Paramicrosporidium saccamoebae]